MAGACDRRRRADVDSDNRESLGPHTVMTAANSDHFRHASRAEDPGDYIVVQPDFDLEGGLELKSALMAAGYDAWRGSTGLDPAGEMTAVYLAANRNDPVLVERMRRLRAMHPHIRSIAITGLSSRYPRDPSNTEPCDSKLSALRAIGFRFLTSEHA